MNKKRVKIDHFPTSPGVYFFENSEGLVLYVGKAKNLKSRIRSYFLKSLDRGPAIDQMVELAVRANYRETDSEIEAVFLEAELIKKLKPKYNTALKDDKSFSLIRISKVTYPCVSLIRGKELDERPEIRKGAVFFGPYPAGLALKKSLRYLRRIFPFRDCPERKFSGQQKKERPCLYGDIKLCPGPCCPSMTQEDYKRNVSYFKSFLKGGKVQIRKSLEREMKKASKRGEFERAASFRDKLMAKSFAPITDLILNFLYSEGSALPAITTDIAPTAYSPIMLEIS